MPGSDAHLISCCTIPSPHLVPMRTAAKSNTAISAAAPDLGSPGPWLGNDDTHFCRLLAKAVQNFPAVTTIDCSARFMLMFNLRVRTNQHECNISVSGAGLTAVKVTVCLRRHKREAREPCWMSWQSSDRTLVPGAN